MSHEQEATNKLRSYIDEDGTDDTYLGWDIDTIEQLSNEEYDLWMRFSSQMRESTMRSLFQNWKTPEQAGEAIKSLLIGNDEISFE